MTSERKTASLLCELVLVDGHPIAKILLQARVMKVNESNRSGKNNNVFWRSCCYTLTITSYSAGLQLVRSSSGASLTNCSSDFQFEMCSAKGVLYGRKADVYAVYRRWYGLRLRHEETQVSQVTTSSSGEDFQNRNVPRQIVRRKENVNLGMDNLHNGHL